VLSQITGGCWQALLFVAEKLEAVSQISASAILEFLDNGHPFSLSYP